MKWITIFAAAVALALCTTASAQDAEEADVLTPREVAHYATEMFHAYDHGGLYHMQQFEAECWEGVTPGDRKGAGRCATYAMTGGVIDGTYAAARGAAPTQFYQGDSIVYRIRDKCRLPEEHMKTLIAQTLAQVNPIVAGLASAGM